MRIKRIILNLIVVCFIIFLGVNTHAETLAVDDAGYPIQVLKLGTVQTLSYTVTAATSTVIKGRRPTTVVRVVCTTDCHIRIGTSPTAVTTDSYMPANTVEYFEVDAGVDSVSIIQDNAAGTAYVTEME